jgi:hypothetical protein
MSSNLTNPVELDISLTNKDVQKLIQEIEEGKIVLPDFQRDFVWPTGQVGKLLESLLNGYYINTLLILPVTGGGDNVPFPPRKVQASSGAIADSGSLEMVLDGQQRITSIHYALTAPDLPLDNTKHPQLFGLAFSSVICGMLGEEAIDWKSTHYGIWDDLQPDDYATQIEKDFIPFTIFRSKDSFDDWRYGMEDYAKETQDISVDDVRRFDRQTRVFRNYGIPIIEMKAGTSPATVVQTFERINTQGLELGIFDILTARLYPKEVHLRDLWADALDRHSNIKEYADNTDQKRVRKHLLKTMALYRNKECKDENVGKLSEIQFETHWDTTVQMVDRALEKAQSAADGGFGVTDKYGFPYSTLLPTLANLLHLAENSETHPRPKDLEMVKRWYWASTFSKRYSGSSDTISYKDYNEGRDWIRGERTEMPESIQDAASIIPGVLDLSSLTRGGPYKGIMSLLMLNDARDFGTFESITIYEVDDHHIFPDAKLKNGATGSKYEKTDRNTILNRTVIESQNNRFNIRDRLPSDYIPSMIDSHPRGEVGIKKLLERHFIDEEGFEALLTDDYQRFCTARKEALRNEIEERIGAPVDWNESEQMV